VSPDLLSECAKLLDEIAFAPARLDLMRRRDIVRAQFDAADVADRDFYLVATLGMQLRELEQQSAQLPLSEEGYLMLPDRHAALVQQVTDRCKELTKAREFAAVAALGAKLSELRAAPPPVDAGIATSRPAGIHMVSDCCGGISLS
jgi:DNA repair ATPase RecN